MRFLLIDANAGPDEIRQAINVLRAKQRRACIPSTAAEIGEDIDALLEMLPR